MAGAACPKHRSQGRYRLPSSATMLTPILKPRPTTTHNRSPQTRTESLEHPLQVVLLKRKSPHASSRPSPLSSDRLIISRHGVLRPALEVMPAVQEAQHQGKNRPPLRLKLANIPW